VTVPKTRKLVDLQIDEASGVDHPAHLFEGWLVRKDATAALDEALTEVELPTHDTDEGNQMDLETTAIETSADEVVIEEEEVVAAEPATTVSKSDDDSTSEVVAKELADLRKALDEATAESASLREEREMEKATERVNEWRILPGVIVGDFAPVLRSLRAADPEGAAVIEGIFDGCAAALAEAGVLKELGTDLDDSSTDAWDQIQGLAKSAVEAGRAQTIPEGVGIVATENPDLYTRYRQEQGV
jgi:hypothetical protein